MKIRLSSFSIIHNIRSIGENSDEFKIFVSDCLYKLYFIVLRETFKISDLKMYNLHGYKMVYNDGNLNRNDRVLVYPRDYIYFEYELTIL